MSKKLKPVSIVVAWSGPYSLDAAKKLKEPGLYLYYGRRYRSRKLPEGSFLYCGISEQDLGKRLASHRGDPYHHKKNKVWAGRVVFPAGKLKRKYLEDAEYAVIYFARPKGNDMKKKSPPVKPVYLISEWFKPDGKTSRRRKNTVMKSVPDVVCWSPERREQRSGDLKTKRHKR